MRCTNDRGVRSSIAGGPPSEPPCQPHEGQAREAGQRYRDGRGRPQRCEHRRERQTNACVDVLYFVGKKIGIVEEALEADQRPREDDESCPERDGNQSCLESPREEQPEHEWPREELCCDRDADRRAGEPRRVPVTPREREGDHERESQIPEEEALHDDRRKDCDDEQPPIANADDPQRGQDADGQDGGPEPTQRRSQRASAVSRAR